MVDLKKMGPGAIAVITLTAIVLIGLAVIGGFEETLRDPMEADDVIVVTTLAAVNVSANIATTYPWAQTLTSCVNDTAHVITAANYTFVPGDYARGGVGTVTLLDGGVEFVGDELNCTITYLADTTESDSAELFQTGLTVFATFMGVMVLAMVGMIVISLFKKKD